MCPVDNIADLSLKQKVPLLYPVQVAVFTFRQLLAPTVIGTEHPMASTASEGASALQAGTLFSVKGLIAVVTGGGTGTFRVNHDMGSTGKSG